MVNQKTILCLAGKVMANVLATGFGGELLMVVTVIVLYSTR